MLENTSKDIYREINFMPITLFSNKLRILVIGGGEAALIKTKAFLNKGCNVEAVALEFIEEFYIIKNLKLNKASYNREFILDKHIIIIAINNTTVIKEIIQDCEELSKIYINSTSFKDGIGVIPVSRECNNVTIAVNTKLGNPKAALMVAEYLIKELEPMDSFIGFTSLIRNKLIMDKTIKKEILAFINTVDFKFFYDKNKHIDLLKLFYEPEIVEKIKALYKER